MMKNNKEKKKLKKNNKEKKNCNQKHTYHFFYIYIKLYPQKKKENTYYRIFFAFH